MAVFHSADQIYTILQEVFARVADHPADITSFTHSNLVFRIHLQNPEATILLDGRQPPLEVFFGERPGRANIEVTMEADMLHHIWLGQASMSQAFFSGAIRTQGNILKARQLVDLFRVCEEVYPAIAAAHRLPV